MAHASRWGWYPCDYETFLLLKKLHACYLRALWRYAAWQRWHRKQPHNRVLRQRLVDDQGRRIGSRVLGPRPEPRLCPVFCSRDQVIRHWNAEGKHLTEGETVERVAFCDHGIPETYRAVRHPALAAELVMPLAMTPETIRRLAAWVEEASRETT